MSAWTLTADGEYAVAAVPVLGIMAGAVNAIHDVRHVSTGTVRTVMEHPPTPGRWVRHDAPWHSCGCGLPYCRHIAAVLEVTRGSAVAAQGAAA